jgi:hypothetical protein
LSICSFDTQVLNDPLQLAFSAIPHAALQYQPTSNGLSTAESLPANVHILTSKWLDCSTILLRLSHMFQAGEHPVLSQQASVQLSAVAKLLRLDVMGIQEATLFGERQLTEMDGKRPSYNYSRTLTKWQPPLVLSNPAISFTSNRLVGSIPLDARVMLNPMQIRTFYLAVRRKSGSASCIDPLQLNKAIAAVGGVNGAAAAAAVDDAALRASLLSIHMDPTIANVALLSRGVLLLLLLVPMSTSVVFGICIVRASSWQVCQGCREASEPSEGKAEGPGLSDAVTFTLISR